MFGCERTNGFQFDNQLSAHNQIAKVFAGAKAVDIENLERLLAFHLEPRLFETVRESVFVDLLQQSDSEVFVDAIGDLADVRRQTLQPRYTFFAAIGRLAG